MIDSNTPNLGRRFDDLATVTKVSRHQWFSEARLGMFVHYGLYSIPGKGEWHMDYARIPAAEYNKLAAEFRAERFDAEEQASLARRAGAGYVVTGARHHEGFCLFDSQTTDFTSVNAPAKRDLIRESVEAFRRANLRVGLYYSIMSWQWPAIYTGPLNDPEGWEAMVNETHAQLRELMSNYGRIDVLWYDGCVVPGVSDPQTISRYWRSRELNAMVRRLQPDILINDRSCLPEDYSTPEQHLSLPPRGRRWEMCMTINDHWGWCPEDDNHKPAKELIEKLILCARYDGNLLLNVGPQPNGSLPQPQVDRLEAVGRWMTANGASVRNSRRTAYTEAEHVLGTATSRGRHLYFHTSDWPGAQARIAGIDSRIAAAHVLFSDQQLMVEQFPDGTATLRGLPPEPIDDLPVVFDIKLSRSAPREKPPELLIEKNTGLFDPAESAVQTFADQGHRARYEIALPVAATGDYVLELNVVGNSVFNIFVNVDGDQVGRLALACIDYPDTLRLEGISLVKGEHTLVVQAEDNVPFTLLAWRLGPIWRQLRSEHWLTIGPFPSPYRVPGKAEEVQAAMLKVYPPEEEFESARIYKGVEGRSVKWEAYKKSHPTIDFSRHASDGGGGVCFGRTVIHSPETRDTQVLLGCDWWANLYVNGKMVLSSRDPEAVRHDASWFNAWKPLPADVRLQKGDNVFLVKCHQGRAGNWFNFYLHEAKTPSGTFDFPADFLREKVKIS